MSKYKLNIDPMGLLCFGRFDGTTLSAFGALDELNELLARAEAAEAERDELKRKLSQGETERLAPDWQRVRIDAAIAAMQGMLARGGGGSVIARAETATEYADAIVAELKKEVAG